MKPRSRLLLLLALLAASGAALLLMSLPADTGAGGTGLVTVPAKPATEPAATPSPPRPAYKRATVAEEREEIIPEALYDSEGRRIERCTEPEC